MLPQTCGLMAVVKADGYGHGAAQVGLACADEGVASFAVATVAEGAHLRRSGVTGDILVLGRAFPEEFRAAYAHDLILTAADRAHALELARCPHPLRVHAAVDTGMARLGLDWSDTDGVQALYGALRMEGLYTHLCAPADREFTALQLRRFFTLAGELRKRGVDPGVLHTQASAGVLCWPGLPCGLARPGLALYGVCPQGCPDPGLRPVLALKCRVASLHTLAPGDTAGYDRAFTAQRPTTLAALSMGYADGLPRSLSHGAGSVLVHGQPAPIAGLVCMDQTLVDVTGIEGVSPGDEATVIGPGLDAATVAAAAGTIPNELLAGLGARVERIYR